METIKDRNFRLKVSYSVKSMSSVSITYFIWWEFLTVITCILLYCKTLALCMLGNFLCFCYGLLTFFKTNFFKKIFQEQYQSVKLFLAFQLQILHIIDILTLCILETPEQVFGKQCRPRWKCCISSGSALLAKIKTAFVDRNTYLENIACDPLKCTMGSPILIVSICMGKSTRIQRVKHKIF